MRKTPFPLLISCLLINVCFAQYTGQTTNNTSKASTQLYVGPILGGTLSKIYFFDDQVRYKSLISAGIDAGIMASVKVNKNFRLNAQLIYALRTKSIEGTDQSRVDNHFKLKSTMQYIELPIFYALEFKNISGKPTAGRQKSYDWYVGAGPVFAYWVGTKGRLNSSNLTENQIDHYDFTGSFDGSLQGAATRGKEIIPEANRFQFGLNVTAGLAFQPQGINRIMTSLHFNLMQTFLGKADGTFPGSTPGTGTNLDDIDVMNVRNHNIRLSVGYLFDSKIEKRKKGKSTIPAKAVQRKRRR
ncbi:hypothetical protein WSM22_00030 [Cytophagales bacterium WSM2-2]|nr:hypothetical protein WSM22_00030 [Cytophagales bacterium WSM2-2]